MKEEPHTFHIVLTIHNSRTSSRMRKYKVRKNRANFLSLGDELIITKCISEVVKRFNLKCSAYNICTDHVHILLTCQPSELSRQVKMIKSISSKQFNRHENDGRNRLWSQKFFYRCTDEVQLGRLSKTVGQVFERTYAQNAILYIQNNRNKHGLERSEELEKIISEFVIS